MFFKFLIILFYFFSNSSVFQWPHNIQYVQKCPKYTCNYDNRYKKIEMVKTMVQTNYLVKGYRDIQMFHQKCANLPFNLL